jgi:phosphoglycerate dehydrogenase-like enzyme
MSESDDVDVAVLRQGVHGMPVEEYAAELRERLPERRIRVAGTRTEERELLRKTTVATARTVDSDLLTPASDLRLFACAYAGYGHLPLAELEEQGVAVTTASGVHAPNVAEHALGAILTFVRRFPEGWRRQQRRQWRHYQADELAGSTVAVVGLGAIGRAVAERLAAFDVEVLGVRGSPERGGPVDEVFGPDGFEEALSRAGYLILACPLTEETRGLVDAGALETLGPEGVLVNVARGPVVDTEALVDALRSNELRAAALDVTDPEPLPEDHPLWGFENVVVTPHNAGHTPAYYERLADIVAENVHRAEETGTWTDLRNQVLPRK